MSNITVSLPLIADGEDKSSPMKNRIRKNYRHLRKWANRTATNCFRIYDRDIKEYPLAIDYYAGQFSVHFFSYDREQDDPDPELKMEIDAILCSLFSCGESDIHWRSRIKRTRTQQYEKVNVLENFFTVVEYGVRFKVNLQDYLDTGLFLDHRETRQMVASLARGKRLLNLFAYTCSFSVHAAAGGASYTESVDMSNTYTDWGRDNFILNGFGANSHRIIRADCLKFLEEAQRNRSQFDLIVIDPPTISRSKKMDQLFDIQEDYPLLITQALRLLAPGGILFFSTNSRKFIFDSHLFPSCEIQEISHKTIPKDFHQKKIHRCWKFIRSIPNLC